MKNWRYVFGAIVLLAANNTYAGWQGNWLLGVSGGYAERRGDVDVSMLYTARPLVAQTDWDDRYSDTGAIWGVLAGYQLKNCGWTWGAEVSVDSQDIDEEQAFVFPDVARLFSWGVRTNYSRDAVIAISGRMAYEMAPYFIPYLRLGAEGSKDSLDVDISGDSTVFPFAVALHNEHWVYRYLVGAGTETPLFCSRASLRLEYNYHSKGKSLEASGIMVSPNPTPFYITQMHPRTQSLKLSLVWNFV